MNGNSCLIDTNIVLYLLNGDETLSEFLLGKQLFLSVISEMELLSFPKITQREQKKIQAFMNDLNMISLQEDIKKTAILLKRKYGIKLPDAIIAASSICMNVPLISSDKQFKQIDRLDFVLYNIEKGTL
jgi:predicted nucleic acid-binding protein